MKKEIAIKLWRVPSTISKEIKRNTRNWVYEPAYAQREYERRRSEINKWRSIIKNDVNMQNTIRKYMMKYKRSPDSIVGRGKVPVCTQTIYNYIAQWEIELKKYCTYKKGYKKHWYKETRGRRKEDYLLITQRDDIVALRTRVGDMEVDTVHSGWKNRMGGLVTIVDRKTKYVFGDKVSQRTAHSVCNVIITELKKIAKEKLFTITADNGKEFYDFKRVSSALDIPFYFTHPYASYERWTNEQTNGMIRKFYPKWTDFSTIDSDQIQLTLQCINRKPRKSLWYLCAEEAFYSIRLDL